VAASIEKARADVHGAFNAVLRWTEGGEHHSLWEFERQLWTLLLSVGRTCMALFLLRQVARPRDAEYRHVGVRFVLAEERVTEVGTRFGKVVFTRPVGRRPSAPWAAADLPIDRELGMCGGFSLGVVLAMTRLCAQMAFGSARLNFNETYEWAPSPRATLRMVDALGAKARAFLEQAPAPEGDGEVLMVQVDARGAPMISELEHGRRSRPRQSPSNSTRRHARRQRRRAHGRKRRAPGKKSKNAKMAVVGVLYTLRRTPDGMEGPINKRLYATFESHEELFIWLRREADKRGYGQKQCLFLADGSEHIWRLQALYFPEAETCLDWYHVLEKVWAAGECFHPAGSTELAAWVGKQANRLRRGAARAVLAAVREELAKIPRTGPGNKGKRERLARLLRCLEDHGHRMRYDVFRRQDLDIGTGAAEGAVRNLVGIRLDGPGMRWGRPRAEWILHLRCIHLNGQWDAFAAYLASNNIILAGSPSPAIPHTAKEAA
jgi:hypothetical protein